MLPAYYFVLGGQDTLLGLRFMKFRNRIYTQPWELDHLFL